MQTQCENMKDEIVISGMSGRFPEADNVAEFYEKLINKVDLVTENDQRWKPGALGTPKRTGRIKDIRKFDSKFFGLDNKEANDQDPQSRILLEVTYETIVDAGYDPNELRGKKIGVFLGHCYNETLPMIDRYRDQEKIDGLEFIGSVDSLLPSRISFVFDFKGPSFLVDTACSSGGMALYQAFQAIRNGDCEAAIVGGTNLILKPGLSCSFQKLKMISDDGKSKSFDASGDGYVRSDAIVTIFLQKLGDARRNYASIVHMKTNTDGYKVEGITYPSCKMQICLMSECFKECNLDPHEISYLEAHATGTPAGDNVEMTAIAAVFCPGQTKPLLVGSVKSNMGHTEPSSALCQIVKLIVSSERGMLPPNIHFNEPHAEIKAFTDGRVIVVTEPTPWTGPYFAFNSFGFGGVNVHGILKCNPVTSELKDKKIKSVPHLMLYCGRTKECVQSVFDSIIVKEASREFFALLHKSCFISPKTKPYRGYKLLGVKDEFQDIKLIQQEKQQLWYLFPGMGTKWPEVDQDVFQIEVFAKSFRKSAEILKSFELNLVEIATSSLKSDSSKVLKAINIMPAIISNVAIQVALVDVLNELDLKPDGIIGHNLGELGCAYADGCFTAEQILVLSYWLAKYIEDSDIIYGMPWYEEHRCSHTSSCHCNEKSETIPEIKSNAKDNEFISKAKTDFTRDFSVCNPTDYFEYVTAAEKLKVFMEKAIPDHKLRCNRWISSLYPEDTSNDPEAKSASVLYFLRSLVSPVNLDDVLRHIPKKAIVIEIGPHNLLGATWRKRIGADASYINLINKDGNNVVNLLSSIGKLYASGLDPKIEKLYPPIVFPVPRGTPMISPLIMWDHSETWNFYKWDETTFLPLAAFVFKPGPVHSADRYLLGHCIDGRKLFPAAGYIVLVWKTFATLNLSENDETAVPVVFENVEFIRGVILSETTETRLIVHVSKTSRAFEILESEIPVCTGFISSPMKTVEKCITSDLKINKESLTLNMNDIYKEFRLSGYEYGETFQGLMAANLSGSEGILEWTENWVTYLDTLFQISIIGLNKRILLIPKGIEKLTIDPLEHVRLAEKALKEYEGIPVKYDAETRECFSAGVYAKNMIVGFQTKRPSTDLPLLEQYKFLPYEACFMPDTQTTLCEEYIKACMSVSNRFLKLSEKDNPLRNFTNTLDIEDQFINKFLTSEENCYILLKYLSRIKDTSSDLEIQQNVKKCVINYINELENDILSQILVSETILRTTSEVILENTLSRNINVVEITEGSRTVSSKIHEYTPALALFKTFYSVLHCDTESLCKEHLPPNAEVIKWERKSSLEFENVDIFILSYLKSSIVDIRVILENVKACLKTDGFILFLVKSKLIGAEEILSSVGEISIPRIDESTLEQSFMDLNLNIICKMSDSFTSTLYLLRNSKTPYKDSIIDITADENYQWVDHLKEKMRKSLDSKFPERTWLVSEDSRHCGIIGLVKCLRLEPGGSNIRCIFTGKETSEIPKFSLSNPFYKKQLEKDLVMNVFQNGSWGSYRHFRCDEDSPIAKSEHAFLNVLKIGDLSSIAWIHSSPPPDNAAICHIYYASLNFKDVMLATGRVPLDAFSGSFNLVDSIIGFEFSGRTPTGRRVMGITTNGAMATTVVANRILLWDVPDEWSLEQAATVPVVYLTAYYSLISRGNLQQGERVLIHSGSGGVGQAAINIALSIGCDVYTTVGSEEKKKFLIETFPQLEEHIYNSRATTFEQHILHATNGEGVDVVLNSLAGDKLFASVNCLAVDGRFLEIGKYDLANNSNLGMASFLKNISFHGILLDWLFYNATEEKTLEVVQLLKNGIADGVVKPLNTTVFNHDQAEQAFRYMASGRHIGKVVLKIRDEEKEKDAIPSPISVSAIVKTTFDPLKSYIIIGGLGGVGLELCQWLIDRSATKIILISRSGVTSGYQRRCLQRWKKASVNVVISKLNAAKFDDARELLVLASKLGPVAGIFNLALVLRDALMENQTVQNYIDVCECKVEATKNFDLLTRELCPDLDYFVCFSSISCGRGNAGQSNYGYANSVMEMICEDRASDGLPGLAVQWGAIGDVGVVEDMIRSDIVNISGTVPQRISSCLTSLDKFLQQRQPVVSSLVPYQPDKADKILRKGDILSYLTNIFGIKDVSSINPEATLSELGMDSLMAVELLQILKLNFDIVLSMQELQMLKVTDLKSITEQENTEETVKNIKPQISIQKTYLGKFHALTGEELNPTDTIVCMNKIADGLPLFLIHSLEGSVVSLQQLAETVPYPVYGIQYTLEAPCDSVENLASWYWKHIKSFNISTQSINLAGYSLGATVAFEMALQAETDPKNYPEIKNVIFLDGSHNLITVILRMLSIRYDEKMENVDDQIAALVAFSIMFSGTQLLDTKELLLQMSFPERIHYTANKIASACPNFCFDDIQTAFEQFISKLRMALKYNPKYKLKREVHLVKASESFAVTKFLTDVYDLDQVCEGKIISNTVEGDHYSFIQGESAKEVSNLLAETFDKK